MTTITHAADTDPFDEVNSRLIQVEDDLRMIKATLEFIEQHIVKSAETIDKVSKEVMPTIEALMETPLIKLLGMKVKK
jgi:hypothetical protein